MNVWKWATAQNVQHRNCAQRNVAWGKAARKSLRNPVKNKMHWFSFFISLEMNKPNGRVVLALEKWLASCQEELIMVSQQTVHIWLIWTMALTMKEETQHVLTLVYIPCPYGVATVPVLWNYYIHPLTGYYLTGTAAQKLTSSVD